MRNGLFYVAKEDGSDKVLGVAMWLPPRPVGQQRTWTELWEEWRFWASQVRVNLWYGRGGLNVKVSFGCLDSRISRPTQPRTSNDGAGWGYTSRATQPVEAVFPFPPERPFSRLAVADAAYPIRGPCPWWDADLGAEPARCREGMLTSADPESGITSSRRRRNGRMRRTGRTQEVTISSTSSSSFPRPGEGGSAGTWSPS